MRLFKLQDNYKYARWDVPSGGVILRGSVYGTDSISFLAAYDAGDYAYVEEIKEVVVEVKAEDYGESEEASPEEASSRKRR